MKTPWKWNKSFFLPRLETLWTCNKIVLLVIALFALVDSLFIPFRRDVDPGGSSEGILAIILTFRATRNIAPPLSVLVAGGCLVVLVAALNHQLISPGFLWTIGGVLLLTFVMFSFRQSQE
jgi:hypothetical protein